MSSLKKKKKKFKTLRRFNSHETNPFNFTHNTKTHTNKQKKTNQIKKRKRKEGKKRGRRKKKYIEIFCQDVRK